MPRRIEDTDHYHKGEPIMGSKLVFGEHRICIRCGGKGIEVPMSRAESRERKRESARGNPPPPRWPCDLCGGSKINGAND